MKNLTRETRRRERESADRTLCAHGARWSVRTLQTVLAALREIFDESAYERFLAGTSASRSAASYRDFLRDREAALARKPRCC
ncbi:MAG TPA: hypothetical protein VIX19_13620 [Terriglobales bacterium]